MLPHVAVAFTAALALTGPVDPRPDEDLRRFGDVTVHVASDRGAAAWLVVRRAGRERAVLGPVARRGGYDVGSDARGEPVVVFVPCPGCGVRRARIDGGGARTVPGTRDAVAPTVSRGRLVWGRAGERHGEVLLTRRLDDPPSAPSHVVRRDPTALGVDDLELDRGRLAAVTQRTFGGEEPELGNVEVRLRLVSLADGRARPVTAMTPGSGTQRYVGPSFAGPHLGFHASCVYPEGCTRRGGAWRLDLRTGVLERAVRRGAGVTGFQLRPGGRATVVEAGAIAEVGPLAFRRTALRP